MPSMEYGTNSGRSYGISAAALGTVVALIAVAAGLVWLVRPTVVPMDALPPPVPVEQLDSGSLAQMDSPALHYSPGWAVSAEGADPAEPVDPWTEPAGTLTFSYTGRQLALQIAPGDYWGYFYATVDGRPANQLPAIRGAVDSRGEPAGYKPLYAPEAATPTGSTATWLVLHEAENDGPHTVYLEVWRSWGQSPLRALGIDTLPPASRPRWPGALLLGLGLGLLVPATTRVWHAGLRRLSAARTLAVFERFPLSPAPASIVGVGLFGLVAVATGVGADNWPITLLGIGVLGLAALVRPAIWIAALAAALPFYYHFTLPLLPALHVSLIDLGVFGGIVLVAAAQLLHAYLGQPPTPRNLKGRSRAHAPVGPTRVDQALFMLAGWALVSATTARYLDPALDEWRLVFLAGAVFGLAILLVLAGSRDADADRTLILVGWLGGATLVAAVGLWQFATGTMLIQAEGVGRIRGFYGSPNNLALYLERALPVLLALAIFAKSGAARLPALGGAMLVGSALLLTFSKGALFLALPTMFLVLWLGGFRLLQEEGRSVRPLWGLAAAGIGAALLLGPFLNTARFANLFDLSQGTGYLRIQLWRSSWQMALDHPLFGVGPDNFLYWYRSDYLLPTAWQEPNLNHPHNWALDWWTRLGLPGLALGLAFWGSGLMRLRSRFRHGDARERPLVLGLLAAGLGALAHGLIDLSYALPDLMLTWVLIFTLCGQWNGWSQPDSSRAGHSGQG